MGDRKKGRSDVKLQSDGKQGTKGGKKGTYRCADKNRSTKKSEKAGDEVLGKRRLEEGTEQEVEGVKKWKSDEAMVVDQTILEAGPANRSCGDQ